MHTIKILKHMTDEILLGMLRDNLVFLEATLEKEVLGRGGGTDKNKPAFKEILTANL